MINYSVISTNGKQTVTAIIEGHNSPIIFTSDNPDYKEMMQAIIEDDKDALLNYSDGVRIKAKQLENLTDRIAFDGDYLYYDNDPIHSTLTDFVIKEIKKHPMGYTNLPIVKFLEKLYENPSENSKLSLFDFISNHDMEIDDNGFIYAYKGVDNNLHSVTSGHGFVNGQEFNNDNLRNYVNDIVTMPRSEVEDNPEVGCSSGLHAGTKEYAANFAPVVVLVKINPRDVVSVPIDSEFQKIRCSKYQVLTVVDKYTKQEEDIEDFEAGTIHLSIDDIIPASSSSSYDDDDYDDYDDYDDDKAFEDDEDDI